MQGQWGDLREMTASETTVLKDKITITRFSDPNWLLFAILGFGSNSECCTPPRVCIYSQRKRSKNRKWKLGSKAVGWFRVRHVLYLNVARSVGLLE